MWRQLNELSKMSLLRGKLLTYLDQQKPNEREQCIQDYRNKDRLILNPRSAKRYQIDDSDKENSPYSWCRDEEECQNEDVEGTIRIVQDILTPEKSKKRVIRDTPYATPDASIKNWRKRSKNGVKHDAVKALYHEVTDILTYLAIRRGYCRWQWWTILFQWFYSTDWACVTNIDSAGEWRNFDLAGEWRNIDLAGEWK